MDSSEVYFARICIHLRAILRPLHLQSWL